MKKLFNLLLVLVMMFILVPAVSAESGRNTDTTGSITITDAVDGETYSIYKIFDLESFDTEAEAYSYKVSDEWVNYFKEDAEGLNYFSLVENKTASGTTETYVVWKEGVEISKASEFAEKALAYAEKNNISATGSDTAANKTVEFDDLELGYYLVDSTVGQLCMLDSTDPDKEIVEKNGTPDIDKTLDTSTDNEGTTNSKSIGDTVTYTVTLTNVKGIINLGFVDAMTEGLDLDKTSFVVTLKDGNDEDEVTDYTVTYPTSGCTVTLSDKTTTPCTFELTIDDSVTKAVVNKSATITVTYAAVVNSNAEVKEPETNTVQIVYGDSNEPKGEPEETETYVHQFTLVKTDDSETATYLEGATFKLYTDKDCKKQVYVTEIEEGHYQVSATEDDTLITSVATDDGVVIEGLANGTYYLKEIDPPVGYNRLATAIEFEIAEENSESAAESKTVTVVNTTGAVLPSTGGMGTILFVVIGSILALGFGIVLITKFRMSKISA